MTMIHAGIFRSGNYYQGVIKVGDGSIKSEPYLSEDEVVEWLGLTDVLKKLLLGK